MADYGSYLDTAGTVGSLLASYYANKAKGELAQTDANNSVFRTRMDAALKGPEISARQTALGDTLANIQPFQWTGDTRMVGNIPVPQSAGGLGPQNFGPNTRAAGAALSKLGLSRVNSPSFNLPDAPGSLGGDGSGGGGSSYLSLAGTLAKAVGPKVIDALGGGAASTVGDYGPTLAQLGADGEGGAAAAGGAAAGGDAAAGGAAGDAAAGNVADAGAGADTGNEAWWKSLIGGGSPAGGGVTSFNGMPTWALNNPNIAGLYGGMGGFTGGAPSSGDWWSGNSGNRAKAR